MNGLCRVECVGGAFIAGYRVGILRGILHKKFLLRGDWFSYHLSIGLRFCDMPGAVYFGARVAARVPARTSHIRHRAPPTIFPKFMYPLL